MGWGGVGRVCLWFQGGGGEPLGLGLGSVILGSGVCVPLGPGGGCVHTPQTPPGHKYTPKIHTCSPPPHGQEAGGTHPTGMLSCGQKCS